jgi:hypothetical protein
VPHQRIITGAHVLCFINGSVLGRVKSVTFAPSIAPDTIRGVDSNLPYELADGPASLSGTIGLWRTIGDGGAEGPGIATPFAQLPRGKYLHLVLLERISDTIVFEAPRCRITSQHWEIRPKVMVEGALSFEAIGWNNEVRPARP